MIRRPRSGFALLLAFALLPIVSMAAGGGEARAQATMAWMAWQGKAQTLPHRAGVGEQATHHTDAMPFVPAETFRLALSQAPAQRTSIAPVVSSAAAPTTLHPARAPPALS